MHEVSGWLNIYKSPMINSVLEDLKMKRQGPKCSEIPSTNLLDLDIIFVPFILNEEKMPQIKI